MSQQFLNKVPWTKLFRVIVSSSAHVAHVGPLGDVAADLILTQLLMIEEEERNILRSIDGKLTALLHGYFNTGMAHLREANKPYRTEEERLAYIEQARLSFMDAYGTEKEARDSFRVSLIQCHVAICRLLLGHIDDARDWFNDSYSTGLRSLEQWHNDSNAKANRRISIIVGSIMGSIELILLLLFLYPLIVIFMFLLIFRLFNNSNSPALSPMVRIRHALRSTEDSVRRLVEEMYFSYSAETIGKGKNIYEFLISLKQLEEDSILGLNFPPFSPSLSEGFFNIEQFEK